MNLCVFSALCKYPHVCMWTRLYFHNNNKSDKFVFSGALWDNIPFTLKPCISDNLVLNSHVICISPKILNPFLVKPNQSKLNWTRSPLFLFALLNYTVHDMENYCNSVLDDLSKMPNYTRKRHEILHSCCFLNILNDLVFIQEQRLSLPLIQIGEKQQSLEV